jgi:hypothetical protein
MSFWQQSIQNDRKSQMRMIHSHSHNIINTDYQITINIHHYSYTFYTFSYGSFKRSFFFRIHPIFSCISSETSLSFISYDFLLSWTNLLVSYFCRLEIMPAASRFSRWSMWSKKAASITSFTSIGGFEKILWMS